MGLIAKVGKVFGGAIAEARAGFAQGVRSLSPDLQSWITGMDVPESDQGAKLKVPYAQSAWVYTAVTSMAKALSQIPFRVSRVGCDKARRVKALRDSAHPRDVDFCRRVLGENVLDAGEVVELFNRPHKSMDKALFWEMVVSWDALRGEVFILPLDNADQPADLAERNPRVTGMITLAPDLLWHMVVGYELEGWRYTGSPLLTPIPSQVLLPTEVIHSRSVNPYLFWRGMSPLLVAMLPASADYAAEMFMKGLLMNNADTGIIATTEQSLTPEQREQFMAALRERKRKAGTPDRPLFLSSGVKIEKPTISNVDMQFLETRKLLRQEIGAIYAVPESVMGFSESKSSSLSGGGNALEQERLSFLEQNIGPKCRKYEAAVAPIVRTFGDDLVGWFDLESLPVFQAARRARVDSATKVFTLGVPFNDINRVYDLGFPEYAWGKTGWLPFSLQPAELAAGEPMPGEDTEPDTEGNEENEGEEEKTGFDRARGLLGSLTAKTTESPKKDVGLSRADAKRLWERHMRARAASVKLVRGKITKVLLEFRVKALAKLNEIHLNGLRGVKYTGPNGEQRSLIDLIFSASEFGTALHMAVHEPLKMTLATAVSDFLDEAGISDPWKMPPPQIAEHLNKRKQAIQGVATTVRDQLNTTLQEGIDNGESTAELAGRLKQKFNSLGEYEAVRVARTEVNMAFNFARQETMKGVGIQYKAWLSSHGPNVREAHQLAEEVYLDNPIPVDEPFIVDGEELMYPGDESGSAGNVINCQCVSIAAWKGDAEEEAYRIAGVGLVRFATARTDNMHGCGCGCESTQH